MHNTFSEFIVSSLSLLISIHFTLQNFFLYVVLTMLIFKIVLRTFPIKFWLAIYKLANNSLNHVAAHDTFP